MISSSNNLYDLIKDSKVEILSVTQRYGAMPDEMYRMTIYEFIKDLEHLVKSGVFNNIDWNFERISNDVLLLTSQSLAHLCNIRLLVEITPVRNTTMQQVIDKLKEGMCVNWVGIYYMIEQRVRINIATSVHMMICADI